MVGGEVVLTGRRAHHIREVHRAAAGRELRVGRVNGRMGSGVVTAVSSEAVRLTVSLEADPPPPSVVTLLLALPRPKSFRRVLQASVTMGVKRIALFGAYRVEKSYWDSPWLLPPAVEELVTLGLEQARDTLWPRISLHPLFKPFVEDDMPEIAADRPRWVAHPDGGQPGAIMAQQEVVVAIGPEGGFTAYELSLLEAAEFARFSLGPRIMRTEQVVPAVLGRFLT